jgi:hypothetical protein
MTVETSTYGSESVASSIAMELILEVRYMLRSLGVALVEDLLCLGSISLGSWETSLSVDELMMLCGEI